jgi:hypothetical protein
MKEIVQIIKESLLTGVVLGADHVPSRHDRWHSMNGARAHRRRTAKA